MKEVIMELLPYIGVVVIIVIIRWIVWFDDNPKKYQYIVMYRTSEGCGHGFVTLIKPVNNIGGVQVFIDNFERHLKRTDIAITNWKLMNVTRSK